MLHQRSIVESQQLVLRLQPPDLLFRGEVARNGCRIRRAEEGRGVPKNLSHITRATRAITFAIILLISGDLHGRQD